MISKANEKSLSKNIHSKHLKHQTTCKVHILTTDPQFKGTDFTNKTISNSESRK